MMEDAFQRGWNHGKRDGHGLPGVPPIPPLTRGVRFSFQRSWADSYINYERALTDELRRLQAQVHAEWCARGSARSTRPSLRSLWAARHRQDWTPESLAELVAQELHEARRAVDGELEQGHGNANVAHGIRWAPIRPYGVRAFDTVAACVADRPERAWARGANDLGGWDFGLAWHMENPLARWQTTAWRISWLESSTSELYAIEAGSAGSQRRVWILGALSDEDRVRELLYGLMPAMHERNSLVVAARAVRDVCEEWAA